MFERVCRIFIAQNVFVVELRHIFCRLVDDQEQFISLEKEMAMFHKVLHRIKKDAPNFQIKFIVIPILTRNRSVR